jgi:hypothetical protein
MSTMNALQKLILERLTNYPGVQALVGTRVLDKPIKEPTYPYITFGAADLRSDDAECVDTEVHVIAIDCWSIAKDGKREVKDIVAAVKRALNRYVAEPEDGALVTMDVVLVRVFDDPDGETLHGVVQVEALMEAP